MICPKCGNEVSLQDVSVFYGYKDGIVDVLAEGNLAVAVCCGVAVLTERVVEESKPEELGIILP